MRQPMNPLRSDRDRRLLIDADSRHTGGLMHAQTSGIACPDTAGYRYLGLSNLRSLHHIRRYAERLLLLTADESRTIGRPQPVRQEPLHIGVVRSRSRQIDD